jgi:hypothetical protein
MAARQLLAVVPRPERPARPTLDDLRSLPPTLDGHQTAEILGCSYWTLLEMEKAGTSPVPALHLGRCLVWGTVAVLRTIGIEPFEAAS